MDCLRLRPELVPKDLVEVPLLLLSLLMQFDHPEAAVAGYVTQITALAIHGGDDDSLPRMSFDGLAIAVTILIICC